MTTAPEDANQTGFQDGTLPADDGGNGNDVIRIGGVAHPEKKTNQRNARPVSTLRTLADWKGQISINSKTEEIGSGKIGTEQIKKGLLAFPRRFGRGPGGRME